MPKPWTTPDLEPPTSLDLHLDLPPTQTTDPTSDPASDPATDPATDPASGPATSRGATRRSTLEAALRAAIREGRLAPGAAIPSSRALARQLGLSRGTVTAAYDQLIAEGYLTARAGSATTVAPTPPIPALPATTDPGRSDSATAIRYDLRPGRPDPGSFPAGAWLRATRRVLVNGPADLHLLTEPAGRPELRVALAEYLGRTRGVIADPDRIVVTSGFAQALGLLMRALRGRSTNPVGTNPVGMGPVGMEEPGHPFHRELVRRTGHRVVPVPVDDRGARTDLLADLADVADQAGHGDPLAAVVVTPAHQYPGGATLHPERRRALVEWARESGGLVIEDDYDGEFRYDRQPVGAVQGMAPESVAYLGSVSKTLAPALRLGWMVLPAALVGPVAEEKLFADTHTASLAQLALADLLTSHAYDRHVRAARLRYRRRRDDLTARLRAEVPRVRVTGVAAGLHALLLLPERGPDDGSDNGLDSGPDSSPDSSPVKKGPNSGLDEATVVAAAAARGLALQPLGDHWHASDDVGQRRPRGFVIGYSTPAEHAWSATLDALVATLHAAGA
jgi:GntR family transcriptional regulator/MocR family aminotransferase